MLIYLIQNNQDLKGYIGQTSQTIKSRWEDHIHKADRNSPFHLHNAIRKYGKDIFGISSLAECDNQRHADYLEALYIQVYNTLDRDHGYNMTAGGEETIGHIVWLKNRANIYPEEYIEYIRQSKTVPDIDSLYKAHLQEVNNSLSNGKEVWCKCHGRLVRSATRNHSKDVVYL